MFENTLVVPALDIEAQHRQLLEDTLLTLASAEPDDVLVQTPVDKELETAPVAWFISYKQGIKADDFPMS